MSMAQKFVLSFFVLVLGYIPPASAQYQLSAKATTSSEVRSSTDTEYALQISTGDLLDVNVFDTPDLSGKLRVDSRGTVTLPLGGDVFISNMTAEDAARKIEAHLRQADILKDPHVSITVLEYATQGVTVLGEVKNPGVYPLLGPHDLLDLISAAGGMTPNAARSVSITHRGDPTHSQTVNVESTAGGGAEFNANIRPGDTIMVARAGIVYVVGDVNKPGGFLIEGNGRLTVLQAIALAQGTSHTASLNHAKIIRKNATAREEVSVPLKKILANKSPDQSLDDGDILFVPGSSAKGALRDVESILPATATAAIYRVP